MTKAEFKHYDWGLVQTFLISSDRPYYRFEPPSEKTFGWDDPFPGFFQSKSIFHMLESIGSARIEGNNTSLLEYMEAGSWKKRLKYLWELKRSKTSKAPWISLKTT